MRVQRTLVVFCLAVVFCWRAQTQPLGQPGGPGYSLPGAGSSFGQIPRAVTQYQQQLGWLKRYAEKLEEKQGERFPEVRQPLKQIQNDATFLQQKWLDWWGRNSRTGFYMQDARLDLYYRVLRESVRQLDQLSSNNSTGLVATVKSIAADLHAKAENCRHSADGLGKEINVTVHTRKGVEEVSGYEVWCAPVALVPFKDEHLRFPKISSPTVYKRLAPGCYAMWLEKGELKTDPVEQTIGGHGETKFDLDLLVTSKADRPGNP